MLDGEPWRQHSRARLHQLWPCEQNVLIRVVQVIAPELLTSLYHANGLTSTKHVRLRLLDASHTEVRIETEVLGEALDPQVKVVDEVLRRIYDTTLQDYANECRVRDGQIPRSQLAETPDQRGKSA